MASTLNSEGASSDPQARKYLVWSFSRTLLRAFDPWQASSSLLAGTCRNAGAVRLELRRVWQHLCRADRLVDKHLKIRQIKISLVALPCCEYIAIGDAVLQVSTVSIIRSSPTRDSHGLPGFYSMRHLLAASLHLSAHVRCIHVRVTCKQHLPSRREQGNA